MVAPLPPTKVVTPPYSLLPPALSDRAQALIAGRLEKGTVSAYQRVWDRYVLWCTGHGLDPATRDRIALAVQTANFVADEQADRDLGHSACKTRVAAISTRLKPILGFGVGEEPIVSALMQGVRKKRPENPRYEDHPDLGLLWALFDRWGPNEGLDQSKLVGKVSSLLLLFGLRKCDQVRIDLAASIIEEDSLRFKALTKETRSTMWVTQPIPGCPEHPFRCCVAAVRDLIRRRPPDCRDTHSFFVSTKGVPVGSKWLGSRVQEVLKAAGVPPRYRPHCLRGMGASRALDGGIPGPLVNLQFRWSPRSDTFARFYLRSTKVQELGRVVYA